MNEIHENLFKLLIELDNICNEHGIDYFLSGGTALGAVRNQCFLPWDDDIDLYITRESWHKLYDLVTNNPDILPENRDFVCLENDKFHRNPIIRYVDTSTTRIYKAQSISGKTCGDQIEFFILDPIPKVEDGQDEHLRIMDAFFEILSPYFLVSKFLSIDEYVKHRELVLSYYERIDKEGFSKVMKELYDKGFTYPIEKTDTLRLRWGMRRGLYKTRFYSKKRYEILEGHKFPVSHELEHALRIDYGDTWMYIPKTDGMVAHNALIEDVNRPFKDFTDIYFRFTNQEKVVNAYEMNKRNNVDISLTRQEITLEKLKLEGIIAKKDIDKLLKDYNYDLEQLLKDRNFDVLDQIFEKYYSAQLNKFSRTNNLMIELDENILKIAVLNKIYQGFYYSANDILSVIEVNEGLNEEFKHYKDICDYCRNLSIAIYDDHSVETVGDLLNNVPKDAHDLVDTFRAELWFKLKTAKANEDYESILEKGNDMLKLYPQDGEIMSYIAESHFNLNDMEQAKKMYDLAVHNTRNGFVWRRAKENVGIDRMAEEDLYVN